MPDPHQQIADLEAEIERLSEAAEQCRKIASAAKVAIAAGVLLLVVTLTGLLRLGPLAFIAAITATLGGIAVLGSNKSTRDTILATLRAHEARRAAMIDALALREIARN